MTRCSVILGKAYFSVLLMGLTEKRIVFYHADKPKYQNEMAGRIPSEKPYRKFSFKLQKKKQDYYEKKTNSKIKPNNS